MSTTPNEFLQFAKQLGLEDKLPNNNNGYKLTGLSVLNNLCYLIEQIHQLKIENDRLRAHLELVNHVDKFLLKKKSNQNLYDEEKSSTLSPTDSLKIKKYSSQNLSISSRDRQDFVNNPEDSSSMLHMESEMMDSNLGLANIPTRNNWNKVRHALKFSLGRKQETLPMNYSLTVPAISISVESDDDHLHENNKYQQKKNKKILLTNNHHNNRKDFTLEDSDHDDDLSEYGGPNEKRKIYRDNKLTSSSTERQENNLPTITILNEEEHLLIRKQSKIAHYRRKLRSKLNTVKRQFSEQNFSTRHSPNLHGSTFDDFKSGINHALLTAKLAPAMTKSYQEKMRQWQTMQKSDFLVNYRRQSIVNKIELNNNNDNNNDNTDAENSRKQSFVSTINETCDEQQTISSPDEQISERKSSFLPLTPTLSPNQRSLIVHQWREIMSEEIYLRHYKNYFERKFNELKQLETNLKYLKTRIFSTNDQNSYLKHHSMTNLEQYDQDLLNQYRKNDLPKRCQSLQSLVSIPASWILAVQSAAYSDILDGTTNKITDKTILLNKQFFNQLQHFKTDRIHFEQDTFKLTKSKINLSDEENLNEKPLNRIRPRLILTRAHLRQASLISLHEIPPMMPSQIIISKFGTSSHIDLLTVTDMESNLPLSSSITLNKRLKRSRFDLKKTLQRSKSMCISQFNSWLHRRRQERQYQQHDEHLSVPRRKSAADSKSDRELRSSPMLTTRFLSSPRLARFHRRIFKQHLLASSPVSSPELSALTPSATSVPLDDSDENFKREDLPVRIYLPARTSSLTRHVPKLNQEIKTPPMSKIPSPIIIPQSISSSKRSPTAKERRESYIALTHLINNQ